MKRSPGTVNAGWFPMLKVVIELLALVLCTWAMAAGRSRDRDLRGSAPPPPPDAAPPATA